MADQASLLLERRQMLLHRPLTELLAFSQATGSKGGLDGEIPQDQRIDRGSRLNSDLRTYLRTDLRTQ